MMMPETDRFERVAALQANAAWRDIPVVVVTALDLTAEDRRRLSGGVREVLSKHAFAPAELMARVGALLAGSKSPKRGRVCIDRGALSRPNYPQSRCRQPGLS